MKKFLLVLLAVVTGLGVAVTRIANIEYSKAFFHNGSWTGSTHLPLGKNNLLTTQITLFALFALPSEEAIYLFAKRDEEKNLLHSENDYTISGNIHQINSKYWSITCYGKDLYLVPNEENLYSFNNANIATDSTGNFEITVSHKKQKGNWLPSPDNARFNLVLRIYKGDKNFLEHLSSTPLPFISIKNNL